MKSLVLLIFVPFILGNDAANQICELCSCDGGVINCDNLEIMKFFTAEEWNETLAASPREIVLSNNKFSEVTEFPMLPILKLDMSRGRIEKIAPASFRFLQNMTSMDLSYNNLTSAALKPDVFEGIYMAEKYEPLRSMRILNVSYNDLHSLHQDLFEHTTELEELILQGNPFTLIDHSTVIAISSLALLKILDMSECQLKKLPDNFLHTPKYLEFLDLSSNEFEFIPSALEEAKSLKSLSLSKNPIRIIDANSTKYTGFTNMPNLEDLHLCYMPILEKIGPKSMSGLTALKRLYMDNNPALSIIDATTFESTDDDGITKLWPMVTELYLERNNLSTIENGLIGRWDLLKHIDIRHNPFLCDCSTQWIVSTLAPIVIQINPDHVSDIICREPIEMRGKSLIHLEEIHSHMRCSDIYGDRPERDGMLLVGTLIGALIAVPVILGIMLLYKRGFFTCFGSREPAAFSRQFYKRADTNDFL